MVIVSLETHAHFLPADKIPVALPVPIVTHFSVNRLNVKEKALTSTEWDYDLSQERIR